jgi:hypothetical protein
MQSAAKAEGGAALQRLWHAADTEKLFFRRYGFVTQQGV